MEIEKAQAFVSTRHRAVLATYRKDGRPQLSPVSAAVDAEGHIVISSRESAYKVGNVRRDPRVSVCVFDDGFFGPWVQIDGTAEIVPLPEALEPLVDYYRAISGEHPDWDDYRAAMVRDRRVIIKIEIQRAGPDREG